MKNKEKNLIENSKGELVEKNPLAPENYKRRLKDRSDGRYLRTLSPLLKFCPFIMATRNDASNMIFDSVELSAIDKYVREKKRQGMTSFNAMYVLMASYVRAVSQKPGVNRFVAGNRVYAHYNIDVVMEVKKALKLNAPATMVKFHFKPEMTADEVYEEMHGVIKAYQDSKEEDEDNGFDKTAQFLTNLPRPILRFAVRVLYRLDYWGLIPASLLEVSSFHCSMCATSMASLGIPSLMHHLYNFGTCPMFLSFTTNRHEYVMNREGVVERKHYLDFAFNTDDRICDGEYYAEALHEIRKYLKNPELLDEPPEEVFYDIP